jgi:hypothetical protein
MPRYNVEIAQPDVDLDRLVVLGRNCGKNSPYGDVGMDDDFTRRFFQGCLSQPQMRVFILKCDKEIVGFLIGTVTNYHPLFFKSPCAAEMGWWVEPEHRGKKSLDLLFHYMTWAKDQGCKFVTSADLPNLDLGPMYTRLGFKKAETAYMMELN